MQSIIMFHEEFAYVSSGKRGTKKRTLTTVKLGKNMAKNGEVLEPEAAAKRILAELKKQHVTPNEAIFVIRSSDVVISDLTTPVVAKKLLKQGVKVALNERYPSVMDHNYIVYKTYSFDETSYHMVAAMAPKTTIDSYRKVAESMRCRLRRIDLYQNCALKRMGEKYAQELDAGAIIADLGKEISLLNYVQKGAVHVSNSFAPAALAAGVGNPIEDMVASQLTEHVSYIVSAVGAEEVCALYLKNNLVLGDEQLASLKERLQEQMGIPVTVTDDMLGGKPHGVMQAALAMDKGPKGDFDFCSELDISDGRNFRSVDVVLSLAAGAAVAALLTIGGYGVLQYNGNMGLEQQIAIDQAFIEANRPIELLYRQEMVMGQELEYLQAVDMYIGKTHYDFVAISKQIETVLSAHNCALQNLKLNADLSLSIAADALTYSDIAGVMTDLKQAGYQGVSVVSVAPPDRADLVGVPGTQNKITYQLYAKYDLKLNAD